MQYIIRGRSEDGTEYYAGHGSWANSRKEALPMTENEAKAFIAERRNPSWVYRLEMVQL